jgi:hypothetical protein
LTEDSTLAARYTSSQNPGLYIYPGFVVPYDPRSLLGYVDPNDPTTYPPAFVLPPEVARYPWLIVNADPYYFIPLSL